MSSIYAENDPESIETTIEKNNRRLRTIAYCLRCLKSRLKQSDEVNYYIDRFLTLLKENLTNNLYFDDTAELFLIEADCKVDIFDAVINNDPHQVEAFLKAGIDPHIVEDHDNITLLHHAVSHGSTDVIDVLLAFGADPKLADSEGATPIDLAMDMGAEAILKKLQQ